MTRSIAHFLLTLVVLACPVQCVIGGDLCCESKAAESEVASGQSCPASGHCCHEPTSVSPESKSCSDEPIHIPSADDDCNCDCLCKGAISSVSLIAENGGATLLHELAVCRIDNTDLSRYPVTPPPAPPDALSGREIRTLRMSSRSSRAFIRKISR